MHRDLAVDISCGMWSASNSLAAARVQGAHRRRIVATIAPTMAVLCVVLRLSAPAHAQTPMVQLWGLLNAKCKDGRPDDPKTLQACEKREKYSARLQRKGCLYQADGDWWKCPH